MGEHLLFWTGARDGKVTLDHTTTAAISAVHSGATTVEGTTIITLQTLEQKTVVVTTEGRMTWTGMVLTGHITVDGNFFFEKQWQ